MHAAITSVPHAGLRRTHVLLNGYRLPVLRAKLDEDEDDSLGERASGWCVEPRWSR
jgi:hypothetical protein